MRDQLTSRLQQLKSEYDSGQQMLAELDQKQRALRETLLRISGAIQVLEEELGRAEAPELPANGAAGLGAAAGDQQ